MDIKRCLEDYSIVGICSNYKIEVENKKVKELNIKDVDKALKIMSLNKDILEKSVDDLTLSELFKVDLMLKLKDEIIVIGGLSKYLIDKDRENIKKLLIKIKNEYNKKIIIIDNDVNVFLGLVKNIFVINDKNIVYMTDDFFDDILYQYVKMPKIIEFIKMVNNDKKILENNIEIYELIKDIYRCVS